MFGEHYETFGIGGRAKRPQPNRRSDRHRDGGKRASSSADVRLDAAVGIKQPESVDAWIRFHAEC